MKKSTKVILGGLAALLGVGVAASTLLKKEDDDTDYECGEYEEETEDDGVDDSDE